MTQTYTLFVILYINYYICFKQTKIMLTGMIDVDTSA